MCPKPTSRDANCVQPVSISQTVVDPKPWKRTDIIHQLIVRTTHGSLEKISHHWSWDAISGCCCWGGDKPHLLTHGVCFYCHLIWEWAPVGGIWRNATSLKFSNSQKVCVAILRTTHKHRCTAYHSRRWTLQSNDREKWGPVQPTQQLLSSLAILSLLCTQCG